MRRFTLALALIAALGIVPSAAAWTWPLGGDVLRPYSLGPDAYAAGQHRGVDVAGASGELVRAPAAGTVSFAGVVPGSGRTVTIQLDGYAVSVTHLGEISVVKGATVGEGQTVGVAGQSGEVEWPTPYVHLGVRVSAAADGYVDPTTLLPPRAVAPPPAPVAPVAVPVAAPVVLPVSVPVAAPVVAPVVVPPVVPVVVPGGAPGATTTPAPILAPVRTSNTDPTPAPITVVPRREPVAVETPPVTVTVIGQSAAAPGGMSSAVERESATVPTVQPLVGTKREASRPLPPAGVGIAAPPAGALASAEDARASSPTLVPGGGGAAIGTVQRGRIAAVGDAPSATAGRSPLREAGAGAAVTVDRAVPTPAARPFDGWKQPDRASPVISDDASTTVEASRLLPLGRGLALAAAALLLVGALVTSLLLARLRRIDGEGELLRHLVVASSTPRI